MADYENPTPPVEGKTSKPIRGTSGSGLDMVDPDAVDASVMEEGVSAPEGVVANTGPWGGDQDPAVSGAEGKYGGKP